jgi:hypothetical protein
MAEIKARGEGTAFRLRQKRSRDMRRGRKPGKDERLQARSEPAQRPAGSPWKKRTWNELPAQIRARIVRVKIGRTGFRALCLWIAATCADSVRYPAQQLAGLYYRRWSIELFCRDIKTTMHMEVMRAKSPDMVRKELLMRAIAYNALRALIVESAREHEQELGRVSFKGAADLLRQWLPRAAACHQQPRKLARRHDELLEAIASVRNPLRRGRQEPRARKRRPKNCQLPTKPRHKFKEIPRRERCRAAA